MHEHTLQTANGSNSKQYERERGREERQEGKGERETERAEGGVEREIRTISMGMNKYLNKAIRAQTFQLLPLKLHAFSQVLGGLILPMVGDILSNHFQFPQSAGSFREPCPFRHPVEACGECKHPPECTRPLLLSL